MSRYCWVLLIKRTAFAAAIVSGLIVSLVLGVQFVLLVEANGLFIHELNGSPIITMKSTLNNKVVSSNTVLVSFTLTRPNSNWVIGETSCAVLGVRIIVDGEVNRSVAVNSELPVAFSYSFNLTDLRNGLHSLQLNAYCRGVSIRRGLPGDFSEYIYYDALSDTVSFTVDAPEPSPEPTSTPTPTPTTTLETTSQSATFPATILLVSSAGIALGVAGLLVYFKKHKRKRPNADSTDGAETA